MQEVVKSQSVIFFDDVCNLCSGVVRIIIKYDATGIFKFVSLQSEIAKQMLGPQGLDTDELASIFLLQNGRIYHKSSAVLQSN